MALQIDEHTMLFIRGVGPIGYPGSAEVVNMQPPAALIKRGITSLPCIGDGRQSGTSASPSILNASPEAAAGGGLALLRTGDRVRVDLRKSRVDVLVTPEEPVVEAPALPGFETKLTKAGGFSVSYRTGQSSVEQVLAAIRQTGLHIKDISTEDPDLEDVFVSLTYAAESAA